MKKNDQRESSSVERSDVNRLNTPFAKFGRKAGLIAIGLFTVVVVSGCSSSTTITDLDYWKRIGMPEPATKEGAEYTLPFWQGSWVAAMIVGIFVWGLIFWAMAVYRRRKSDGVPRQIQYNMPLEALWTVVPLIMVIAIFSFAARDEAALTAVQDDTPTVGVQAFRWSWAFNYYDQDVYDTGLPANFGAEELNGPVIGADPEMPMLWLVKDKKVKFELTSPDVIHSFWVPAFLTKLDVVPGRTNYLEVTPNKLGMFAGKCAELCGVDHSRMLFNVNVVTQEEFNEHVEELKKKGQTGKMQDRTTDRAQVV